MVYVLLLIVTLFALAAALCFERKLLAASVTIMVLGGFYFFQGAFGTLGVPDELVASDDAIRIETGLLVAGVGVLMYAASWFLDIRAQNPRR